MLTNIKPLRVDSALRALSTLRGLRGAPKVPPLCRETRSLGQHMELSFEIATVGKNGLTIVLWPLEYYSVCLYRHGTPTQYKHGALKHFLIFNILKMMSTKSTISQKIKIAKIGNCFPYVSEHCASFGTKNQFCHFW